MSTVAQLREQWINPADVSTILMVIGGDVVQNAFAQGTGQLYTPVCFSFGCVAYAFITLVNIIGDGRLLPRPDYPVKVFNLESGYARENKNWVVGRLLRDIESQVSRKRPLHDDTGIRISVFEALENDNAPTEFPWSFVHVIGVCATVLQLAIAAVPIVIDRQWGIMFITIIGTLLIQIAGLLPQWRAEKLPNGQKSKDCYALTSGNGASDIVVILGRGLCLNLEEMSASQSPRVNRPWEKFQRLSQPVDLEKSEKVPRVDSQGRKAKQFHGFPLGFRLTQITCWVLSVLWLLLLVNVAASVDYTWCILGVGAVGMFQNAWLAAVELPPAKRNMPLYLCDTIMTHKVMDGIMDFDMTYHRGIPLMEEFFPGRLKPEEHEWWRGNRKGYDEKRMQSSNRGIPRSVQPVPATSTLDSGLHRRMSWFDADRPQSLSHIDYEPSTKWDDLRTRDRSRKHDTLDKVQEVDHDRDDSRSRAQHAKQTQTEDRPSPNQQQEPASVDSVTSPFTGAAPESPSSARVTDPGKVSVDFAYERTRSPAWA
ncbi:hypothetical protein PG996_003154 [Apiospora saccharicola]|uniref:Uncharacterized protein n=1 Tax=Apiospora saccharicola TaxID=335842 RepID=A0ABR1W494_9PEZI